MSGSLARVISSLINPIRLLRNVTEMFNEILTYTNRCVIINSVVMFVLFQINCFNRLQKVESEF
jgi:hypothetical protein